MKTPIVHQNQSNQNLLEIIIFVIISIISFRFMNVNLFSECSEPVKQILGTPPQAIYVNMSLVMYLFSAFVIRVVSIIMDIKPIIKWSHLGYRISFYFFLALSGSISENFYGVFFIGIGLYLLDQFHIQLYNYKHSEEKSIIKGGHHV